ncbi:MAG: O-methyltransferase [Deltaproteobacteria bacterium]|nr:O-methyltransferase [Deltaproteobacteria bacterium]
MIPNPEEYFRQLVPTRDALLLALEEEARQEGIPIVGPVVGELLFILARATQARHILELGTATGYSAIYLAQACDVFEGRVVTLEMDDAMARRAQANFEKAGLEHRVEILVGDAFKEMTKMQGPFDFAFLDIDKESYAGALSHCERLLKPGGFLVADNVAFQGADEFNRVVSAHSHWRAVHLLSLLPQHSPEKDGLCLAVRV